MKRWMIVFFLIGAFFLSGLSGAEEVLTEETILQIAIGAVKDVKMSPDNMDAFYDRENREWKKFYGSLKGLYDKNSIPLPESCLKLEGRDYQAVNFTQKDLSSEEGNIWIFIDRRTGEVITNLFWM